MQPKLGVKFQRKVACGRSTWKKGSLGSRERWAISSPAGSGPQWPALRVRAAQNRLLSPKHTVSWRIELLIATTPFLGQCQRAPDWRHFLSPGPMRVRGQRLKKVFYFILYHFRIRQLPKRFPVWWNRSFSPLYTRNSCNFLVKITQLVLTITREDNMYF